MFWLLVLLNLVIASPVTKHLNYLPVEVFNRIVDYLNPTDAINLGYASKSIMKSKFFDFDSQFIRLIVPNMFAFFDNLERLQNIQRYESVGRQMRLFLNGVKTGTIELNLDILDELQIVDKGFWERDLVQILKEKEHVPIADELFYWACKCGYLRILRHLLLNSLVDPSSRENVAVRLASCYGQIEVLNILLECENVDPTARANEALRKAASNGYLNIVRRLLECPGVDPADGNNYAIRYASSNGHYGVVKLLLEQKNVDPSANDNQALRLAEIYGHALIVELLT